MEGRKGRENKGKGAGQEWEQWGQSWNQWDYNGGGGEGGKGGKSKKGGKGEGKWSNAGSRGRNEDPDHIGAERLATRGHPQPLLDRRNRRRNIHASR